jgi:hypothetical protein
MTIKELIQLVRNRVVFLNSQKSIAIQQGDVAWLEKLDTDIASSEITLNTLLGLE